MFFTQRYAKCVWDFAFPSPFLWESIKKEESEIEPN